MNADDIRAAPTEIHGHFGTLQTSLNTEVHDEDLAGVGLAGAQVQVKRKGFKAAISGLFTGPKRGMNRLRSRLRWSGTLIGSITAGLKKEIESVRGGLLHLGPLHFLSLPA